MRRDAEVAPKCLLRSLVIRNGIVWNGCLRPKRGKEKRKTGREGRVGRVIMVGCITT